MMSGGIDVIGMYAYSFSFIVDIKEKSLRSASINRAPGVDKVLLMKSLNNGMSAFGVWCGPVYSIRLPPTVHLIRYRCCFCGR